MASRDLKRFLFKVNQLQKLVDSLYEVPGRKELLEACSTHDEVVHLAKTWGFDIGRRWGE